MYKLDVVVWDIVPVWAILSWSQIKHVKIAII